MCKYQLIYTVGGQQQVDGGAERWKTIQSILELVKKHAADIAQQLSVKMFVINHLNVKVLFHNFVYNHINHFHYYVKI